MRHRVPCVGQCLSIVCLSSWLVAGLGCATSKPPPPLRSPAATVGVLHYEGTPLTGPIATPASAPAKAALPADQALLVRVRWVALTQMPDKGFVPLSSEAQLICAGRGASPVLSSGQLTRAARVAAVGASPSDLAEMGNSSEAAAMIAESNGALLPGITAVFTVDDPQPVRDPVLQGPITRRLAVAVHRVSGAAAPSAAPATQPPEQVEVALFVEDLVDSTGRGARLQRELALLEPTPLNDGPERVIAMPFRFNSSAQAQVVLAVMDIAPPDDSPAFVDAYAKCKSDLSGGNAAAGATLAAWQPRANWSALSAALEALDVRPRPALSQAASEAGATLCGEVALVADEQTVKLLGQRVREKLAAQPLEPKEAVGWAMDSTCIALLAELETAGKLSPELLAVLAAHAGETGRSAATLAELAKSVHSGAEFSQRVAAENYIDLEDNSPAARVRAFDWLRARKLEPAGFDPLAPPRERRVALDKAAAPAPAAQPAAAAK